MYNETLQKLAQSAKFKSDMLAGKPLKYLVFSMMAGFYLGIAVFISYTVAAPFYLSGSPAVKLLFGAPFAIALVLIVFAGAELFTGNTMFMTVGVLNKEVSPSQLGMVWLFSFLGNLLGGILFALLIWFSGYLTSDNQTAAMMTAYTAAKTSAPALNIFSKGILCNIMVCIALWGCARITAEGAKMFLIYLCLFTFVNSGYEHCVANMPLFAMALLTPESGATLAGCLYNLLFSTLGNIVGGSLFVGASYWYIGSREGGK